MTTIPRAAGAFPAAPEPRTVHAHTWADLPRAPGLSEPPTTPAPDLDPDALRLGLASVVMSSASASQSINMLASLAEREIERCMKLTERAPDLHRSMALIRCALYDIVGHAEAISARADELREDFGDAIEPAFILREAREGGAA